jgi:hypothetical protein
MKSTIRISLDVIRDDARYLVNQGLIGRQQPIYMLCPHFSESEWNGIETELESNDFSLRDRVIDLLGREDWLED